MRKIMASLDIGNGTTKLIVGEMTKGKFNVLSVSQEQTLGVKKGEITDEEALKQTITNVINDAKSKLNLDITKMIVALPCKDVESTIGEAKISIENNIISGQDISKVILESYKGIIPDNMELVNVIPMHFKTDDNKVVLDPKNMESKTLSIKSVILMSPKKEVYKFLSVLDKLNIDIVDISLDCIGDYYCYKNDSIDSQIGAIINIGDYKTTTSIFNKGILTNTHILDLGGRNIDNDISYIYKVSLEQAKKLKEEFAYASPKFTSSSDQITVKNKDNKEIKINHQEISKIVYSRIKEILENIKKELKYLTKKEISYIIVCGATSELIDFKLVLENIFKEDASIGKIKYLGVRNNKFSSAIGLIKWYNYIQLLKDKDYSIFSIEEQEDLSGVENGELNNNSVINKFFSYFLDN